jgi:hypothetical protein
MDNNPPEYYFADNVAVTVNGIPATAALQEGGSLEFRAEFTVPELFLDLDLTDGPVTFLGEEAQAVLNTLELLLDQRNGSDQLGEYQLDNEGASFRYDIGCDGTFDFRIDKWNWSPRIQAVTVTQDEECSLFAPTTLTVNTTVAEDMLWNYYWSEKAYYPVLNYYPFVTPVHEVEFTVTVPTEENNRWFSSDVTYEENDEYGIFWDDMFWEEIDDEDGEIIPFDGDPEMEHFELGKTYTTTLELSSEDKVFNGDTLYLITPDPDGTGILSWELNPYDTPTSAMLRLYYTPTGTVVITGNPMDAHVVEGTTVTFSVQADGEDLSYQWQVLGPEEDVWTDSDDQGANTDTLTLQPGLERDGQQFRCEVTNAYGGSAFSLPASLQVDPKPAPGPIKAIFTAARPGVIIVSWSGSEYADHYRLARQTTGENWVLLEEAFTGTVYEDTNVVAGTRYRYAVTPENEIGRASCRERV